MAVNGLLPENHLENGREFHGWRKGLYMYPCDEAEKDRMDIFHHMFQLACRDILHQAPVVERRDGSTRILDLGTGTGIWAIDMADKYPHAEVLGTDIVNIQPPSIPPNLRFKIPIDYEGMWTFGQDSFDLIHIRMAYGGVSTWPELYNKVFMHLKPREGYLEQVEIDFEPRCDDGEVPKIVHDWYGWLADATTRGSKSIRYIHNTRDLLRAQGFVDIEDRVIRLPFNTWPSGTSSERARERELGRWYNVGLCEGLEAMSLGPLARAYRWPVADIIRLVGDVKKAICNRGFHVYNNMHVITARRP